MGDDERRGVGAATLNPGGPGGDAPPLCFAGVVGCCAVHCCSRFIDLGAGSEHILWRLVSPGTYTVAQHV